MLGFWRHRSAVVLVLAGLMIGACALVASTWSSFGHTWDEPEHLAAGLQLVDTGHYDYDIQHPPIARVLLAIGPYWAGARAQGLPPPDGKAEGIAILYGAGHYDLYLSLARAGTLPFLALLILVTYLWGRTLMDRPGALVAAALVATTPTVLGHAGLATIDVAAAASCLLAVYAFRQWLRRGRYRDAVFLGLAAGLALGVKMSAIPYGGIAGVVVLGLHWLERRHAAPLGPAIRARRWWLGGFGALLLVGLVLDLAYGGRWIYLTDHLHHFNQAIGYLFGYKTGVFKEPAYDLFEYLPVPLALQWYLGALQAITVHNDNGHLSYVLGALHTGGWPKFYLLALGVKTQWPLLFGAVAGFAVLLRRAVRDAQVAALALPLMGLGILWFASDYSHINIGVRHVLVLYPLLAVGAAVALQALWRRGQYAGAAGWGAWLLVAVAVVAQAYSLTTTWPDYLAYFNPFAPVPAKILVDSDLDWGQDFKHLRHRLAVLHVPAVSLAYLGTADLAREGLPPYRLLAPDEPTTGWVAVSALARAYAPRHLAWLDAYPVRERIGQTIDLYYIPAVSDPAAAGVGTTPARP